MRLRLGLGATIVLALMMLPASALAAGPIHHVRVSGTFTDADFCGTGQSIEVRTTAVLDFYGRRGNIRRGVGSQRTVFYDAATDRKVVLKSAGDMHLRKVRRDDSLAIVSSLRGAPALIKTGKGTENLYRSVDPGYVRFVTKFSPEREYLGSEVVQRPISLGSNRAFDRLCRISTNALGI